MVAENGSVRRVSIIMVEALLPRFHVFVGQSQQIYEFFVLFVSAASRSTSVQLSSPSYPRFKILNFLSASFFAWPFVKKSNVTFFTYPASTNQQQNLSIALFLFYPLQLSDVCNCQVLQRRPTLPRLLIAPREYASADQVQIQTEYAIDRPTVSSDFVPRCTPSTHAFPVFFVGHFDTTSSKAFS